MQGDGGRPRLAVNLWNHRRSVIQDSFLLDHSTGQLQVAHFVCGSLINIVRRPKVGIAASRGYSYPLFPL